MSGEAGAGQLQRRESSVKGKLSAIPASKVGERPYYCEMYCKLAKANVTAHECLATMRDFMWSCHTVYGLGNYKTHNFVPNERIQSKLVTPLVHLQKVDVWEERSDAMKEFVKLALPACEQAVYAAHRLFRNRSPIPSTLIPIDNSTSFIAADIGVFIHVWGSHKDAKMFTAATQNMQQRIHDLRIDCISCPFSVLFSLHSVTVTATPLIPIVSEKPVAVDNSPILAHLVEQLEVYSRAKEPLKVHRGADGRYYVLEMDAVLHNDGESNGEWSNLVRPVLIDRHPNAPATTPQAMHECMLKETEGVIADLLEAVNAKGESCGGVINVKIQELVMEKVISRKCHARGFKMCYVYNLYAHPKLQGDGAEAVVRETIVAEMVCRTMKEIMRAEVALVPMAPSPDAPVATAANFVVELLNRCTFSLLVKQELWEPHFLATLRIKFRTPDSFTVSHIAVTKRTVLAYLTTRIGCIFENGKFSRVAPMNLGNTLPKPCEVTKLVLSNQRNDAHQLLLADWKRAADIRAPSLQICTMIHQVSLFALARSASLDWFINLLTKKVNDVGDATIQTVVQPVVIEAMGELPEADKFRSALGLYLANVIRTIAADKKAVADVAVAAERYRHAASMLAAIERGREKDAVGDLYTKAAKMLLMVPATAAPLSSESTVTTLSNAMNYIYTQRDRHPDVQAFFEVLRQTYTTPERWTKLCERFQIFSGGSLAPGYAAGREAAAIFREVAVENQRIHGKHYGESDQKYHIALMLAAAHWAEFKRPELNKEEIASMEKFRDATLRIHGALVSEQKSMLRGEWYVAMTGPAAKVLMDHGEWATAQYIIGFGHNVLSEGHFKSTKGKITTAVIPQLEVATKQLLVGINAAERLQRAVRMRRKKREEAEAKAKEEAAHAEELRKRRLLVCDTVLDPQRLVAAAKQCIDVTARTDNLVIPPLVSLYAKRAHGTALLGLKTLLCVAPIRRTANLSAVLVQSGTFPPFKWAITPHSSGVRNMVVVPETECLGAWWHRTWLQRADYMESQCPLFAKVAACFIFSQHKYTFLSWNIIGYGWAGCIAQCLALLIPGDSIDALITFSSPPNFTKVRDFIKVPHAHIVHEEDLVPRLLGEVAAARARSCLISRLEGMGAILPDPPTERDLSDHAYLVHYGRHNQELRGDGDGGNQGKVQLMSVEAMQTAFDVRTMTPGFSAAHYHALLLRALGKAAPVPPRFRPPMRELTLDCMSAEGEPEQKLLDAIFVPDGVEPIACKPQNLLLAYPKLGQSIYDGHARIPDDYGMESIPSVELIDSLEKCRTTAALADVLASFLGASWDPLWCARQLFELSGVGPHAEAAGELGGGAAGDVNNPSKAKRQQALMRRQSSAVYGNTLSTPLIEAFVEKHNLLFQVAPEQRGVETTVSKMVRRKDGGTPVYIDNVDDETRKIMAGPDGYHLGWCVAVASTVRSIGKTTLINALANASLENSIVSMTHKRTSRSLQIPSVRMRWKPKNVTVGGSGAPAETEGQPSPGAATAAKVEAPLFLQIHFQEVRWDGKMAAQTLMRCAAQVLWLVVDGYTFDHLVRTVKFSTDTLSVIVYAPRFAPESDVVQRISSYCLQHSMLFTIVDVSRNDSIEGLQRLLVYWMVPSFHFPINPMHLPPGVEVGALYSRNEQEIAQYVSNAVRPTFGNMFSPAPKRITAVKPPAATDGASSSSAAVATKRPGEGDLGDDPFVNFASVDADLDGETITVVKDNPTAASPTTRQPPRPAPTPAPGKAQTQPQQSKAPAPAPAPSAVQASSSKAPAAAPAANEKNSMRAAARAARAELEAEEKGVTATAKKK